MSNFLTILPPPIPQDTAPHLDETDPITPQDVMDEPYWIEQPTHKEEYQSYLG